MGCYSFLPVAPATKRWSVVSGAGWPADGMSDAPLLFQSEGAGRHALDGGEGADLRGVESQIG